MDTVPVAPRRDGHDGIEVYGAGGRGSGEAVPPRNGGRLKLGAAAAAIFIVLLLLGVPLFIVIGLASGFCLHFIGHYPLTVIAQQMFTATDNFTLLAIPFFILASTIMTAGGSAKRIVDFISSLVEWFPGGLALATVMGCVFFAALSGISPATIVAVGGMMYPALKKAGYSENFSLGLITSSGSIGILIPPSIVVIIFGIIGGVAINELFLAGAIPIAMIAGIFAVYSVAAGLMDRAGRKRFSPRAAAGAFYRGFWGILLPALIIGGIYAGVFTVTEASAAAVVYAFVVEFFFYREIGIRRLPALFADAAVTTGMVMIIVAVTLGFSWFLTVQRVPHMMAEVITARISSPLGFLVLVNLLLLLLGCLMDILSAILITVPILLPIAETMGIDPVHFGIIFMVNFEIGYLTPPVGMHLFVSSAVFNKSIVAVSRSIVPFIALLLAALAVITYFPQVSLYLVNAARGLP
ncbi:MAG: TRAP transporter large permease subunit [bacterium]